MIGWILKPIAYASTLAFTTLGLLSSRSQRARFYFNFTLYLSILGASSVWGVIVSILATIAGKRLDINYYVARSFYGVTRPAIGITLELEGEEHLTGLLTAREGKNQSAVLVGNHQSVLDILYLGRIFPRRASIMAKQELFWSPLLGQYLTLSGAVFVDRKNRAAAMQALEQAGEDMKKKGVSLWIFPEGTRTLSPEPTLLPFKKGAFHLAIQAQVPIIPVVCENYHRLFDGRTRMNPGTLRIKVLPPVSTIGLSPEDVTSLAESTRQLMLEALRSISQSNAQPSTQSDLYEKRPAVMNTLSDTPVEAEEEDGTTEEVLEKVRGAGSEDGRVSETETTDDEMDEDAVLLKRPTAEL